MNSMGKTGKVKLHNVLLICKYIRIYAGCSKKKFVFWPFSHFNAILLVILCSVQKLQLSYSSTHERVKGQ